MSKVSVDYNFVFWLHLILVICVWIGPFVFPWELMCIAYVGVILQFMFLKRCVLNKHHALEESSNPDSTFYSVLLNIVGIPHSYSKLKTFVRKALHPLLLFITIVWQLVFGFEVNWW